MLKSLVQPKSLAIAAAETVKNAIREIREILNSFIVSSLGFLMALQLISKIHASLIRRKIMIGIYINQSSPRLNNYLILKD
jgi:hypothetical protein